MPQGPRTRHRGHPSARAWPGMLAACLLLGACHPGIEEDGWELNDDVGQRSMGLACPNGGKVSPGTPSFGKSIEGYASYAGQSKCSPTARAGVVAFKSLLLATYPCTYSGGITRSCSSGGKSEHKEGRAFDWMVKYPHPAADSVIKWLLATDKYGNKHANARRLGIMYMVWNRKIWGSYKASQGWRKYSGSNPHTDHIHFSFSWAGANKQTSFWTKPMPPANTPPRGYLDAADCSSVRGWAQDPDVPSAAIKVHLYFDGGPGQKGASGYSVAANQHRADLCAAIKSCKHGFSFKLPAKFLDGKAHKVRAYGIDSKGGPNPELKGSPKSLSCAAPAPPKPPTPPKPPAADLTPPAQDAGAGPAPDLGPAPRGGDVLRAPPLEVDGGAPGEVPPLAASPQVTLDGGCAASWQAGPRPLAGAGLVLLLLAVLRGRARRRMIGL